jgi:anti-anti-sigma factor
VKIRIDRKERIATIVLPEKSIREAAVALNKEIRTLLESDIRTLVFDFGKTQMIDSSTLGVLLHSRREHPAGQVEMVIANARGYVRGLLENARLTAMFKFLDAQEVQS